MLIICIIFINCVSASDVDDLKDNLTVDEVNLPENNPLIQNYTIDSESIYDYFDDDGILLDNYSNSIFNIEEDIQNFGIIEIPFDNVTFIGNNHNLKNTVFYIYGNNVTLCNFSMELYHAFEEIRGSGIFIEGSNVTVDGIFMEYFVPPDMEAYGICAEGAESSLVKNLIITNCNVFFAANNAIAIANNYAMDLSYCYNASVKNNVFTGSFPLKNVIYDLNSGAFASSETVCLLAMVMSDYTHLDSNTFIANVESRNGEYPTLDGIFIFGSNNCNITNNNLTMYDFISLSGVDNYLYGIDMYRLNNISLTGNNVHIETTGGAVSHGTAYPIQISGPLNNVTIAYNNLYSKSNGPNLGIYSQNYYGSTTLYIYNNNINITGLAGEHEWALVAGIETQDDYAYIVNNTIEVHSVREVGENDNLYGISYRQKTNGNHTQIVSDNIVFSDGLYSVYMLSTLNSVITNNVLVSTRDDINYGYGGYKAGSGSHIGDTIYNNRIINYYDYFARLYNNAVGNRTEMYRYQENVNNLTNEFDGTGMVGKDTGSPTYSSNPTKDAASNLKYKSIPTEGGGSSTGGNGNGNGYGGNGNSGSTNGNGNSASAGGNQNTGSKSRSYGMYPSNMTFSGDDRSSSSEEGLSWMDYVLQYVNSNTDTGSEVVTSYNGNVESADVESNDTESTPDIAGSDSPASSSTGSKASSSGAGATASSAESQPKAYDISKKTDESLPSSNIYLSFALIIITMLLLIIGYRRKDSKENY